MTVDINDLRLSLIWTEPSLALLQEPAPTGAPLAALGRRYSYESLFKKILESHFGANSAKDLLLHLLVGASTPLPMLGPPWPKPSGQLFWQRYLDVGSLDTVGGGQAWRALVPLRVKFPCYVETPDWLADAPKPLNLSLLFEAFFYPHGVAFVANAVFRAVPVDPATPAKRFTLEDAAGLAFKVKGEKFKVKWEGEAGLFSNVKWGVQDESELTLDEIAKKGLAALHVAASGTSTASGSASILDPFTIFTVVKGAGVHPASPVDKDIQRALEAVTRWSDTWLYDDPLPALDEMKVEIKRSPVGHVLYGYKRGRAAWFPATFIKTGKKYSLACYHRNLLFASLQVESLSGLTKVIADMIRKKQPLSASLTDCARQAGGSLGRLYGKPKKSAEAPETALEPPEKSYRSMSPRIQIEQNQYVNDINTVRDFLKIGDALKA